MPGERTRGKAGTLASGRNFDQQIRRGRMRDVS